MRLQFLLFALLLGTILLARHVRCEKSNVCKTFDDYYRMDGNPNCWYSPDPKLDGIGLIRRNGYPAEDYKVQTEDGFTLDMFRIPRKNARGIALLQHPALTCGTIWLDKGNRSLAYMMYAAGYDVWISNSRGTIYSRKHFNMTIDQPEFWDQGCDEMSKYDVPAQLKLIKKVTKTKDGDPRVAYIGHSMGGTIAVLYPTLYPDEAAKNLKISVGLGPALSLKYSDHPFWPLIKVFADMVPGLLNDLNFHYILDKNLTDYVNLFCARTDVGVEICARLIYFMMGMDTYDNQINPEWFPTVFSQNPGGTPAKVFLHYMQNAKYGKFQPWDYGPEGNLKRYNSTKVPEYPVEKIKVPMLFVSGGNDIVSSAKDAEEIFQRIKDKNARKYGHYLIPGFNHFDYVYGKQSYYLYKNLIKFLNKVFPVLNKS